MRFKCKCAYDGTSFLGWQSQVGGNTVQDIIEERLYTIFKEKIRIHGSSRTDSGVHAKEQVFHFDTEWKHSEKDLLNALSSGLTSEIQLFDLEKTDYNFHARFSTKGKRYRYRIYLGYASPFECRYVWSYTSSVLNLDMMQKASAVFIGKHDFTAFAANRNDSSDENPVKELRLLDVMQDGMYIDIITEGSGYLYKMVRTIVGALVEVSKGKLEIGDIENMLKEGVRMKNIAVAPANGLFLEKVYY